MPTRREAILDALLAKLATVANVAEYRSRLDPVDRSEGVAALLYPESEQTQEAGIGKTLIRRLAVRVDVIARGAVPDEVADAAVSGCHAAIMADPTLAGACTTIEEAGIDWAMESADLDAVRVSRRYDVIYTLRLDDDTAAA